jgi:hypothetical protein
MLLDYEMRWQVSFDWVLRLRTDMLLLAPLVHYSQLAPGAHLVKGMVVAAVNDHTALVSRAHAPAYFEVAKELQCTVTNATGGGGSSRHSARGAAGKQVHVPASKMVDDHFLIVSRLVAHHVPIWLLHMGYVLIRPGLPLGQFHYDCWRLLLKSAALPAANSTPWSWYGDHGGGTTGQAYGIYFPYCCDHLAPTYTTCVNGWGSYNGTKRLGFAASRL